MINFTNATFIKSAPSLEDKPEKALKEVLFVGKSNVGKSSLINALTSHKNLAFTSSKPGFTKLLNYYEIDQQFYLVDAPGYGYTISGSRELESFGKMMEEYFSNPQLKLVVFLVDSRHKMGQNDEEFYSFLLEEKIPHIVVATKGDKLNQKERAQLQKNMKQINPKMDYLEVSVNEIKKIEALRTKIAQMIA